MIIKPRYPSLVNTSMPITQTMICCFLLNEGTGSAIKNLAPGFDDGILQNSPDWVVRNSGNAVLLDAAGTFPYIDLGTSNYPRENHTTLEILFCPKVLTGNPGIFAKRNDWNASDMLFDLFIETATNVAFWRDGGTKVALSFSFVAGEWVHLTLVQDSTGSRIYKNGVLSDTGSKLSYGTGTASTFLVGANDHNSEPLDGEISYFRVWDRALSSQEVLTLYHEPFKMFMEESFVFPPLLSINLQPVDGSSAAAGTEPTITQNHDLTIVDGSSAAVGDSPTLSQNHALQPDDGSSAAAGTNPTIAQDHVLTVVDGSSAAAGTEPGITQDHVLVIVDGSSAAVGDSPTLSQNHALQPDDGSSAAAGTNPTLGNNVAAGRLALTVEAKRPEINFSSE